MIKPAITLSPEFVEFLPGDIQEGKLYISIPYATATHKCCCGCGNEVVTPLSPTDWKLIFDGETVSLDPSIGNWSFDCRTHYWIKRNHVVWAEAWSKEQVEMGRAYDRHTKSNVYNKQGSAIAPDEPPVSSNQKKPESHASKGFWSKLKALWPF